MCGNEGVDFRGKDKVQLLVSLFVSVFPSRFKFWDERWSEVEWMEHTVCVKGCAIKVEKGFFFCDTFCGSM